MVEPVRVRRLAAGWLVVLALLATSACSWSADKPDAPYFVSYSGAAERLAALDPSEQQEQLRDWARLGLASSLGLHREQIVDALYDTTPIRDPLFAGLAEQPTGPGRALFDGVTLHVLIPQHDPRSSRTIGLLLDQHRADAGADPVQVQVHRYQVRPQRLRVELTAEPAAPTREIRATHGWHEARVDQPQGLAGFLAATDHLSRLETRGAEVWAAGWRWPQTAKPGASVSVADLSVLQRGYRQPGGTLPGFSLDPGPLSTVADMRAAIAGLAPEWADRITSGSWAGSGFASAAELADLIRGTLFNNHPPADALPRGLPADRTRLWALLNRLEGGQVYSQARYDGGLAGTEVGMTLFYTDFVAKDWTFGVGTGVPSDAVPGFVPDSKAVTPASLCRGEPLRESGRLWFGQNDDAFTFEPDGVGIGERATRLFARSNGPDGTEVETSFRFGRGLRWWDQHYQEIADYEPQYQRLEQLMRWSGALEWLTTTGPTNGRGLLPQLPDRAIPADLRFADWYATHRELRERAPLTLVTPPSASQEALLPTPSASTPNCGLTQIAGGVSLANLLARSQRLPSGAVPLPPGIRRAGPVDPHTTKVNLGTGTGQIDRLTLGENGQIADRVTQVLRREPDVASVETVGGPRRSIPFGAARPKDEAGSRRLTTEFRSNGPDFAVDVGYQGAPFDGVTVRRPPSSGVRQTDISLRPGPLEHLHAAIARISAGGGRGLDTAPGVRYHYPGPEGQTVYRFDNGWIEVGTGPTSSRTTFAAQVVTLGGEVVEVRAGMPRQLSETDIATLEVTQAATVATFSDMLTMISPTAVIYRGDIGSLVGPEPAATLPVAIPADARVRFRIAKTTRDPRSPGPILGEGRTWSLVDRPGGSDGQGGGPGGGGFNGGGVGAGGFGPGGFGPGPGSGGQIVLVTECYQDTHRQPLPQQDGECR